jgi:hypothetical protein
VNGGAVPGLENVLAGLGDGVTGNFTAAGDRFAAVGDPAGAAEPVPRTSGHPETVSAAPPWTAPRPGGGGRITVARDVLRSVAGRMRSELATLDSAVSRVRAVGAGVGSLPGWPTGDAFSGNAINAHDGCLSASEQVGDGHQAVAGNLSDSAATYDAAESDSTQAVHGVAAVLDGSPAASSAAAGNAFAGGTAAMPSGRAGGAAPAAGPYPVTSNDVQPFDAAGMTTAQIMSILHRLDSGAVAEAGTAHTALGRELDTMAGHLTGYAQTLAQSWTGTAAQAAMARLQQLYDQTSVLAAQAAQTGSVLTWLGTDVLPAFQRLQTPGTGSALATGATAGGVIGGAVAGAGGAMAGTAVGAAAAGLDALLTGAGAAAQAQAQKYLSALSGYLVTANSSLPGQIGGPAVLASASRGGPGTNGTDKAATGAASAGGPASGIANGPVTGRSGPTGLVTSRTAAGSGGLVLGGAGAGGVGAALRTGRTGSAAGAGGAGSAPGTGGGGSAADAVAGSPSDAGGGGSALPAAATGSAPGAGGSALSGGGAGAPVSGDSRIASPAPAVNTLQSAAPVPGSTPGVAPVPPPAAASASGTSGAGSLNVGGASSLPPVPMVPGLPGSGAGAVANGGGNAGDGSNQGRSGDGEAGAPAPAGMLPGLQGEAGAPAPAGMLPGLQGEAGAGGVPQVPGLDGGLTGGAAPVPEGPGLVAPSAVPGTVPVAGATGSFVVTPDGTAVPGPGDSSGRGMLGGMPMAGGTGQPEKERRRRAWGSEDENVWGLPSGRVPPVIEGG